MASNSIKLQSSDGEIFDTTVDIVKCSGTLKPVIEALGLNFTKEQFVPLPNVNAATLRKVLEWATYHKDDDPAPIEDADENREKWSDVICQWDQLFLRVDKITLYELTMTANDLDIKALLDTCCQTMANMLRGKTSEEMRQTFNIKNDLTPEEEEQIRRENEWCEEM
ncbi:S-phase kinase-associated protein 1-like [Sabethes cyaneus]|uniref:S-phase kinase-associated protein 1-like n=1 Tax=Sabethes cyaneus TaxID=53552 RepID=UPI00237DC608|nr:S-phase kinase-associated protein 1-like [Sabethes cyaneus]